MEGKPFIKLFQSIKGYYLYDVNKNEIVSISKHTYELLDDLVRSNNVFNSHVSAIASDEHEIRQLVEAGYLSDNHPQKIEHELTPYLQDYLERRVETLILQVTQACNFKCRYCGYAGEGYLDRKHNNQSMSVETARKAIDFYKKSNIDLELARIYFYGGEPLFEIELIKEVVKYAKEEMPEKSWVFTMSTNLSILTDEILEFLVENNITVIVSLDGPEEVHNKFRRFASNGKGTFDSVYKKLLKIYNEYPDYYLKYVKVNAVVDRETPINEIQDFFETEPLNKIEVNYTPLDTGKSNLHYNPNQEFVFEYAENEFIKRFNDIVFSKEKDGKGSLLGNQLLFATIADYTEFCKQLSKKTEIDTLHHSGQCIPGQYKMFVNVSGDIVTCEKASDKSDMMRFGNIRDGIDFTKASNILNIGKVTENECKNCWAIRFCSTCALLADNYDSFSKDLKLRNCVSEKKRVENLLCDYSLLRKYIN